MNRCYKIKLQVKYKHDELKKNQFPYTPVPKIINSISACALLIIAIIIAITTKY